jgi:uncharacterized membrane protein (DUF2068 family)
MTAGPERHATGVRIIIGYKLGKAVLQLAAAILLAYGASHGLADRLADFAEKLREHAVHAWSNLVAATLLRFTHHGRHTLWWAVAALAGDGTVSAVEGWALSRGYFWGEWLVVGTTSALLPFEVMALLRHVRLGRLVLFALNVGIVVYLVRRARHRSVETRVSIDEPPSIR